MDQQKQHGIASAVEALNRHIRLKEISDFRIDRLEGETLTLVGSFDLSYYHDLALVITGVSSVNLSCCFWVDLSEPQPFSAALRGYRRPQLYRLRRPPAGGDRLRGGHLPSD